MHLSVPLRMPAEGWPFIQIPPGEYELCEHSGVYLELRVCQEFSWYFSFSEIEAMREAGDMTVDRRWTEDTLRRARAAAAGSSPTTP